MLKTIHQKDAKNRFKEVKDFKVFFYIFTKRKLYFQNKKQPDYKVSGLVFVTIIVFPLLKSQNQKMKFDYIHIHP